MVRPVRRYNRRKQKGTPILPIVLVGIVLLAVVAEIAARFFVPVDEAIGSRTPWQPQRSALLGWSHRPDLLIAWPPGGTHKIRTNPQGFVGSPIPPKSADGLYRIVVLGDDLVEALAVDPAQSFCQLLQQILNDQPQTGTTSQVEVVNCGVGGYSTVQAFLLGNAKGANLYAQLKPDLVLLMLSLPNDLVENQPSALDTGETIAPVARTVARPQIVMSPGSPARVEPIYFSLPSPNLLGVAAHYSTLVNLVLPHPVLRPIPRAKPSKTLIANYRTELAPRTPYREAWDMLRGLLKEMRIDAAAHEAAFLAVSAPDRPELIHGAAWEQVLAEHGSLETHEVDAPEQRLHDFAVKERFPFFSLTRRLRQYVCEQNLHWQEKQGYGLMVPELPQFSPRGHQAVAEILADELRQRFPAALGGDVRQFATPTGTVQGRMLAHGDGQALLSRTTFRAQLELDAPVREARAIIDGATTVPAAYGFWLPGATDVCQGMRTLSFILDPGELPAGHHSVMLDVLDASGTTLRVEDRLDVLTGLHFARIEAPASGTVLSEPFEVSGWAVSLLGVSEVQVMLGNTLIASATCSIPRPDLADQLSSDVLETAPGFSVAVPALPVEPGDHQLRLRIVTLEGKAVDVGTPVSVTVPL